jgi:transglutaminase-like putative cysteine protease
MLYRGLQNAVYRTDGLTDMLEHTDAGPILTWTDKSLWGKRVQRYEFVDYNLIRVNEPVPPELRPNFRGADEFEIDGDDVKPKYVGRYVCEVNTRTSVLDVVFERCRQIPEYTTGRKAVFQSWTYETPDSCVRDFVMETIEVLPYEQRTVETVLRCIMSEFSSQNSETGLINARWDDEYSDGRPPMSWTNPTDVFRLWRRNRKPVKYGQCWLFAEAMTVCLRFLGIPTRTVFAENSHMDFGLNGHIDFIHKQTTKSDAEESLGNEGDAHEIEYNAIDVPSFLWGTAKGDYDGAIRAVFSTNDSLWNIHYWNEVWIRRDGEYGWFALDSCPSVASLEMPFAGKKVLGPCPVNSIQMGPFHSLYDYTYINASVNSPFRVWSVGEWSVGSETIEVPYVSDLVYPFYKDKSITTNRKLRGFTRKRVQLWTRTERGMSEITNSYKMPYRVISDYLLSGNPIQFFSKNGRIWVTINDNEGEYDVQQVVLMNSVIVNVQRAIGKLDDVVPVQLASPDCILSILILREPQYWSQLIPYDST